MAPKARLRFLYRCLWYRTCACIGSSSAPHQQSINTTPVNAHILALKIKDTAQEDGIDQDRTVSPHKRDVKRSYTSEDGANACDIVSLFGEFAIKVV